jgi:pyrimidine-nucleoside phosphorylase/thymidine phosphorylase
LDDGSAWSSFVAMVEAQGGRASDLEGDRTLHGEGEVEEHQVPAPFDGWMADLDAMAVGRAVMALGGGRGADGQAPHPGVGVILARRPGDPLVRGEPWARLIVGRGTDPAPARRLVEGALVLSERRPEPIPVIRERLRPDA